MIMVTENELEAVRPAPEYKVGDWAYHPHQQANARVVAVVWDERANSYTGAWRYWLPGYGALIESFYAENPEKPYVRYAETTGDTWRLIGLCTRNETNLPLGPRYARVNVTKAA